MNFLGQGFQRSHHYSQTHTDIDATKTLSRHIRAGKTVVLSDCSKLERQSAVNVGNDSCSGLVSA